MKATFALILFTVAAFAVPFPSKDDSPGIELRGAQESGSRHARDYGDDHHHGGHHKDDDCDDGDGDGDDHDNDPGDGGDGDGHPAYKPCTVGRPQCCAAGLLGVVNIDCTAPEGTISSLDGFKSTCRQDGKQARCCAVPLVSPLMPWVLPW